MGFVPETDDLCYDEHGRVGWLTLNRPAARNALTFAMYEGIGQLCSMPLAELPAVVVITGAGDRAFAAGTDISQFTSFEGEEDVLSYERRMSELLAMLESCPVPTIAAIRGACTGGGAAIAAACDLRVGSPSSRLGMPIARTLGNCLSLDNYRRLAEVIGASRLKEIIFTARLVDAAEAERIGWLHRVSATDESLIDEVQSLAEQIAGHAPLTLRTTKEALHRLSVAASASGSETDDRALLLRCYLSHDFKEGVDAFLSKRPPNWQGN